MSNEIVFLYPPVVFQFVVLSANYIFYMIYATRCYLENYIYINSSINIFILNQIIFSFVLLCIYNFSNMKYSQNLSFTYLIVAAILTIAEFGTNSFEKSDVEFKYMAYCLTVLTISASILFIMKIDYERIKSFNIKKVIFLSNKFSFDEKYYTLAILFMNLMHSQISIFTVELNYILTPYSKYKKIYDIPNFVLPIILIFFGFLMLKINRNVNTTLFKIFKAMHIFFHSIQIASQIFKILFFFFNSSIELCILIAISFIYTFLSLIVSLLIYDEKFKIEKIVKKSQESQKCPEPETKYEKSIIPKSMIPLKVIDRNKFGEICDDNYYKSLIELISGHLNERNEKDLNGIIDQTKDILSKYKLDDIINDMSNKLKNVDYINGQSDEISSFYFQYFAAKFLTQIFQNNKCKDIEITDKHLYCYIFKGDDMGKLCRICIEILIKDIFVDLIQFFFTSISKLDKNILSNKDLTDKLKNFLNLLPTEFKKTKYLLTKFFVCFAKSLIKQRKFDVR